MLKYSAPWFEPLWSSLQNPTLQTACKYKVWFEKKTQTNKNKNISHQPISVSGSDASKVHSSVGLPEILCHPQHCVTFLWCETRLGLAPASSTYLQPRWKLKEQQTNAVISLTLQKCVWLNSCHTALWQQKRVLQFLIGKVPAPPVGTERLVCLRAVHVLDLASFWSSWLSTLLSGIFSHYFHFLSHQLIFLVSFYSQFPKLNKQGKYMVR